ncbi:hypothetical protein BDW62DRAFT_214539 [Aspergillus aurantiobrunneus]
MPPSIPSGQRTKRRRRVYACDSCYRKKIKCDGTPPKCEWCRHHNIACTYTRNQEPARPQPRKPPSPQPLRTPPTSSDAGTPVEKEVHIASRSPYPTPGPQAVAPQGLGSSLCFAGQSLGSIGGFNGLPVFSQSGMQWIKARTGEDVCLDWYSTVPVPVQMPSRDDSPPASLPDISLLRQLLNCYVSSISGQTFPVVNLACFEYTIKAAYGHELSDISPGISSAKACIFAFMAMCSIHTDSSEAAATSIDKYAWEVHNLLPEILAESVTLDGLQAFIMLSFCCHALSLGTLRVELLLSSAARYIFHLKGNLYPKSTDPLRANLHVRNLFWVCFILDKISGLRTGLQPLYDATSCDLTLPQPTSYDDPFHTLVRLAIVQSDIYRGLYSVSAYRKSDAELLATIRALDETLEEWWISVPGYSEDPTGELSIIAYIFDMQYNYCTAAIHQASSRCTAWVLNHDTRAAGSSLAISICAGRSVLNRFLEGQPHILGRHLMTYLPELTVSAIHIFSSILTNPLESISGSDLTLLRRALLHLPKHIWPQAPASFTAQVHLVERLMTDLQRLAECAIAKALREGGMIY